MRLRGCERLQNGLPGNSVNTGPSCKARQRLPLQPLFNAACAVGRQLAEQAPGAWLWQGFNGIMADGTTVLGPDTEDNQNAFPQQSHQKPGLGFPIARLVTLISLGVGTVFDYAVGPYCRVREPGKPRYLVRSSHLYLQASYGWPTATIARMPLWFC